MAVKVMIPTPLRQYTGKQEFIEIEAKTVEEALAGLTSQYADLRRHLLNDQGKLRNFVNVYVNDEDIRYLAKEQTPLGEKDVLSIVPSIAGGRTTGVAAELTKEEMLRYSRHLVMPEVGPEGQLMLKRAKVLCIGAGGLGSPLALYLAAAGVGRLGLVDFDVVDYTNLQRQVIHDTNDVGRSKLVSARETIEDINPGVEVVPYETRLTSQNALDILRDYDVVADGTDNFPTRYLVNDACALLGKPNVYGSIFRFEGQVSVFYAERGPCYRCLYPEPPPPGMVPSCAEGGVLGVLPGIIGSLQALETIKLILGRGEPLIGRLLLFDALALKFRELKLRKNPDCPVCGEHRTVTRLIDYEQFCGVRGEASAAPGRIPEITAVELKRMMDERRPFLLIDVREPYEADICSIPGSRLIPLAQVPERARELDPAQEIVVHCRSGGRSARAAEILRRQGFSRVSNLKGGILAWSDQVDPTLPKY